MDLLDGVSTTKLNRSSLSHQIAERLINDIQAGIFKAGSLLPSANELAREFGVSRPVIRECLTYLSGQGFVRIVNGKGAVVQEVNEQPLKTFFERALRLNGDALMDLLDIRKILEIKSASLAAVNRSEKDLSVLRSILDEMFGNRGSTHDLSRQDIRFHIAISKCSGNSFLFYLIRSIRDSLVAFNDELLLSVLSDRVSSLLGIHERIFQAIQARDPQAAEREMCSHFDEVIKRVKASASLTGAD